jgi:hypothetical protein
MRRKHHPEALNHVGTAPKPLPFTAIPCAKLRSNARMELSLKPTSAKVKDYYNALNQFGQLNISHETAVRQAFASLLDTCARQFKWKLVRHC